MKYSVNDLHRMRIAIIAMLGYIPGIYESEQHSASIERYLNTYMQNGTTPEELEAAAAGENLERWRANISANKRIP